MKKLIYLLKNTGLAVACLGMFSTSANAATFTAVASGNFSSTATWGGIAPSSIVLNDVIIIPANITVNMDQNQVFTGVLASLVVNGTLNGGAGKSLVMGSGSFTGNGTIDVDSMALGLTSGFGFTGNLTADALSTTGASVATAATVTVNNSLYLSSGILNILSGSINLANNSTIVVSGGSVSSNGGTLGLGNNFNVRADQ